MHASLTPTLFIVFCSNWKQNIGDHFTILLYVDLETTDDRCRSPVGLSLSIDECGISVPFSASRRASG